MDSIIEDLLEKDIFSVSPDEELHTDLTSDTEKPPIVFISSNLGIKIFKNALYIVTKNNINIYFGDLYENISFKKCIKFILTFGKTKASLICLKNI